MLSILRAKVLIAAVSLLLPFRALHAQVDSSPLPEHPRPDHQREAWQNLNGPWQFRFDPSDAGLGQVWQDGGEEFDREILVPFPWGAPLSGIPDSADIGWYRRTINVPESWTGRRIFLVVGASDWMTTAWLDGVELGEHQGGYTPFEFELTSLIEPGQDHDLVMRVDDAPREFRLDGKQGYGNARGIWQTVYLDARGQVPIDYVHFIPDIEGGKATVDVALLDPVDGDTPFELEIAGVGASTHIVPDGSDTIRFDVSIPDPRLWTLDDPHLYEAVASIEGDTVSTYFGMRSISVVDLPGLGHPYIALNGEPVYLEMALDQAYHPDGYYTFPSDDFMRNEILRSRQIGLNGMRVHVKIAIPRKLYWADRLGMLIMADVPNSWGEPTPEMRHEVEYALERMIERDYNHPSIFSWIPFNESWGLKTHDDDEGDSEGDYLPETQEWVASVYRKARELDSTRLVEDNSVCCFGHTETDINSWHVYTAGYAMADHLDEIVEKTYSGSEWNFLNGRTQGRQPLFNSEFGNVWGYEGSTGDVDFSWDYHIFINEFRRRPKIAGWLYTEHHDVVNEWNGYWRYDRSEKFTGMDEIVDGMSLRDLHAPFYIVVGEPSVMSHEVAAGAEVDVPLWASFMTGSAAHGDAFTLDAELYGWDSVGRQWTSESPVSAGRPVEFRPWRSEELSPLSVTMPAEPGLAVLAVRLLDASGAVLHRNFTTFVVDGNKPTEISVGADKNARLVTVAADDYSDAVWSEKQWDVLDGLKVNGTGSGYFEYRIPWPADVSPDSVDAASFIFEASAKQLFGKDRDTYERGGDYMRGLGSHDPSLNPNAYPMTDETRFASAVTVIFNGITAGTFELEDDPADHRGILSWHAQPQDRTLKEAGSYGWLIDAAVPREALRAAAEDGSLIVRLEVSDALPHGLAIYGSRFGRYPLDPTLKLVRRAR